MKQSIAKCIMFLVLGKAHNESSTNVKCQIKLCFLSINNISWLTLLLTYVFRYRKKYTIWNTDNSGDLEFFVLIAACWELLKHGVMVTKRISESVTTQGISEWMNWLSLPNLKRMFSQPELHCTITLALGFISSVLWISLEWARYRFYSEFRVIEV